MKPKWRFGRFAAAMNLRFNMGSTKLFIFEISSRRDRIGVHSRGATSLDAEIRTNDRKV